LSQYTLSDYQNTFRRFAKFVAPDDPPLASITLAQVEGLSRKTALNYHVGLSALWTWALGRRMVDEHVGVHAHPHKFRRTGATLFLRNGGNAFALKKILGHSTMTMVNRYVHLAQIDIDDAHRRASPVYNWDLRL
jgi:hypothetical protein